MKNLIYILILILHSAVFGQDLHSSNIQYLSTIYNPALTALKNETEGILTHRSQWRKVGSPYTANMVSFGTTLMPNRRKNQGYLALGFNGYNEQMNKTSSISSFVVNSAYHVYFTEQIKLSTGINAGYYGFKMDEAKGSWESQFNGLYYDSNLNSGENFVTQKQSKFDVGSGVVFTVLSRNKRVNLFQMGISAFHLNRPNMSFLTNGTNRLPIRYVGFGSFAIPLKKRGAYIESSLLFQQQLKFTSLTMGAMLKIKLIEKAKYTSQYSKLNEVFGGIGGYLRNKDAIIINISLQKSNWTASLAYDANISGLKQANNNNGAVEIQMSFTIPIYGVGR